MNKQCSKFTLWWYRTQLSVRPAQLGSFLKKVFCIRRRVVQSAHGSVYWVDPVSVFGLELLTKGVYEAELTKVLQTFLRSGDTFIDVGGNEGYFSMLAAKQVERGSVYCIEPQQRLVPVIKKNTSLNSATSVAVHNLAFSDQKGMAELFLRPSTNTGASSFSRHWKLGGTTQKTETVTLDEFVAAQSLKQVRLIKVDCEGAECLVIKGGVKSINNQIFDFLVVDYHVSIIGKEACDNIHVQILDAGYLLAKFEGLNIYYLPRSERDLENLDDWRLAKSWHE